jgi:hypothetical protein
VRGDDLRAAGTARGSAWLLDHVGRQAIEPARYDMEQDAAALQVLNLD